MANRNTRANPDTDADDDGETWGISAQSLLALVLRQQLFAGDDTSESDSDYVPEDEEEEDEEVLAVVEEEDGDSRPSLKRSRTAASSSDSLDSSTSPSSSKAQARGAGDSPSQSVYRFLRERETSRLPSTSVVSLANAFVPNTKGKVALRYRNRAYSGQFSEDGSFFYSCTQDFKVHLYDTANIDDFRPTKLFRAEIGQWTITDCSLSTDNRFMVYSSITPVVYLSRVSDEVYGPDQMELNFSVDDNDFGIWSVRFSGDGREIVAGASDSCIYVYDIESKRILHQIPGHVCFADPASSHVLFSGSDDTDRRSLGSNAEPSGVLVGHTEGLTKHFDYRFVYSGSADGFVYIYDAASGDLVKRLGVRDAVKKDPNCGADEDFDTDNFLYYIPRQSGTVVRDVSWHPYLPVVVSTTWSGPAEAGCLVRHDFIGEEEETNKNTS
ncbi:hypothetical protein HK102_007264 [Quaeritorhiza haematococci]|nr:hypothetical protein HK102_007264 [Quaeritorhiza haematococci]